MAEAEMDLPKALVKRIVKAKIAEVGGVDETRKDFQLNKDALLAFAESAKVFINYLTATAHDVCKEKQRSTISAEDVFQALEDLEFAEFVTPLTEALEAFKKDAREKSKKRAEQTKKRKEFKEWKERQGGFGTDEVMVEPADDDDLEPQMKMARDGEVSGDDGDGDDMA